MNRQKFLDRLVLNVVMAVINVPLIWGGIAITERTNFKLATYGYTLIILPFVSNFFLNYALYDEQYQKESPDTKKNKKITTKSVIIPMLILDILCLLQYLFMKGVF